MIDVGGVLGSIEGDGKKIIDRLLLIILKMLTSRSKHGVPTTGSKMNVAL